MRRLTFLMGLALVLLHGTTAGATTIGTTSQNGDVFTLSYVTGAADPIDGNNNAWLVTVSVNTIGHTLPASDYFDAIAEKLGAPDGGAAGFSVSAGGGSWAYMAGGTSNSGAGCNGQGNGFECYQYGNGAKALDNGSTWSWTWVVDDPNLSPPAHIKAIWYNVDGRFVDRMSLDTTGGNYEQTPAVPEPASLLLLGTGLALVARRARRKSRTDS